MPTQLSFISSMALPQLQQLGQTIRTHRKALGVSATATAQAAGMSRVTLHRIEKGEPSVTMGAYMNAMAALGLALQAFNPNTPPASHPLHSLPEWIPARVRLSEFPQLKQLAWQIHGTDELTPLEALDIYERNARHLDVQAMPPQEQQLLTALKAALGQGPLHV